MNSSGHIHPEFAHILEMSDEERLYFIDKPRWIGYTQANHVMDSLSTLIQKPKRPRMPNLLLVGESNNGKTTIVRRFKETCGEPYVDDEAGAVIPAVVTESPPTADEKGLYIAILEKFFTPYRARDPIAKLRYQVIHLFRKCNVRMLVIDEFHSMLTGTAKKQREVMNAIKLLCNELCIPVVGVGTRDAVRILHSDPQHASRFDVISLPLWRLNKEFQKLLASFESVLPLKKPSGLHEPALAQLFHSISGGNIGDLHRLLMECAKQAIRSGEEQITMEIVKSKSWVRPTKGIREIIA